MLSNNVPSTPRPRPPAKMRRAPSLPLHPPPPYAPRLDMILDSPISVTTQRIGSPPGEGALDTQAMDQWMDETSREELSDLLVAAEGIIKTRESELGLTSALCKNLYEENVQLKNKHDALLARLPIQGPSPLPSPTRSLSPLPPGSPHYYSISRPGSPISNPSPIVRHARRISVTPSELSLLADQNAELLDKLEMLEEESAQADLAGKRKLRKLEREIQGLREELDKTRAKGMELEEKANVLALSEDDLVRRKLEEKEERAERAKALREKSSAASSAGSSGDSSLGEPVRDFAPPPELPSVKNPTKSPATTTLNLPIRAPSPLPILSLISKSASPVSEPLPLTSEQEGTSARPKSRMRPRPDRSLSSAPSSYFPPAAQESNVPPLPLEYAVISQLLTKIRELEETNAQIAAAQKTTTERLQAAQWDAESIGRAYECLVDGQREVHVVAEDDRAESDDDIEHNDTEQSTGERPKTMPGMSRRSTGDTIRFSSLRRTIDGDLSRTSFSSGVFSAPTSPDKEQIELDFAQGILREMQSTTRSRLAVLPQSHRTGNNKARKSVMGLFNSVEVAGSTSSATDSLYPRTLNVSPAFLAQTRREDDSGEVDGDVSIWSTDATDGYARRSPSSVPSFLISPSLSRAPSPSPSTHMLTTGSRNGHTLGSELGMEDWPADDDARRWNYHLRTSSLCDLTALAGVGNESADSSAERGTVTAPAGTSQTTPVLAAPSTPQRTRSTSSSGWEDVSDDDNIKAERERSTIVTSQSAASIGSATPTRGPLGVDEGLRMQLIIEPPTPSPNRPLRASRSSRSLRLPASASASGVSVSGLFAEGSVRDGRASRNQRLSQTVRARTSRWIEKMERRYGTMGAGAGAGAGAEEGGGARGVKRRRSLGGLRGHGYGARRTSGAGTLDMDETFEAIMAQFSRSNSALSHLASGSRAGADADASLLSADLSQELLEQEGDVSLSAEVMAARPRREGFVGLLLEVWLWLQFAVVVMVFLWAMARRGPKSVLEDAERRRGVAGR